ncbi:hypothetical protein J45TS6_05370 [Paenibacillus sp. J45TS6]|uniref:hypothetical protein n=1 Tax=Paenibacillus sp. J45TS6 TaxID=2807196 RepID=UPI001B1D44F6|nr:hypothetical protein [Paenibacillus sp. J45TS6]GIP42078.1 hypothetical protein J45TS6_05370 [Paenibacillus sp. J45TS6]
MTTNNLRADRPSGKIASAIFTAILLSIVTGLYRYVPLDERLADVHYYSFGYTFTITLLINLAIFLFLIMPLSILVDGLLMYRRRNNKYFILLLTFEYCLLGLISGVIFSAFILNFDTFTAQTIYITVGSLVFLAFQLIFNRIFPTTRRK